MQQGDRIAQLVLYFIAQPSVSAVTALKDTTRGQNGFGSTSTSEFVSRNMTSTPVPNVLDMNPEQESLPVGDICQSIIDEDGIKPYNLWLSSDPFDKQLSVTIDVKGDHPSLGLIVEKCDTRNRLKLIDIAKSIPAARLPSWRSTLKFGHILSIDDMDILTKEDLEVAIAQ